MVSAGPGSGKTLTVAAWLARFTGPQAWLTVDETDNDLRTFWSDVLAALAIGAAVPEDSPLRELVPAPSFGAAEALQVRAGLAGLPGPVVLVLDDVHHLSNPEVLDSLSALIEQRPLPLRLVMLTRADPALRLHRVRVSGGLTEIRSEDLAFTKEETTELFAHDGIELTDDQLRLVLDRTQGWPVGVRLAAMFLSSAGVTRGIEKFTGTERSVAEYLVGEVLDRQPAPVREFLLRTSIVERLNPSLATALIGPRRQQPGVGGSGGGERFRRRPWRRQRLVPLPPAAARAVGTPVDPGAARDRGPVASQGGGVVHRAWPPDPGDRARNSCRGLGRGRPAVDRIGVALDPDARRPGVGGGAGAGCPPCRRMSRG